MNAENKNCPVIDGRGKHRQETGYKEYGGMKIPVGNSSMIIGSRDVLFNSPVTRMLEDQKQEKEQPEQTETEETQVEKSAQKPQVIATKGGVQIYPPADVREFHLPF